MKKEQKARAKTKPAAKKDKSLIELGFEGKSKLTLKENRFCGLFLLHLNAGRAAREAGYSKKSDYDIGYRLLRKVEIREEVSRRIAERMDALQLDQTRILSELITIALANPQEVFDSQTGAPIPSHELPDEVARTIDRMHIETKVDRNGNKIERYRYRFCDKLKALEMIMRYLSCNTEHLRIQMEEFQGAVLDTMKELGPAAVAVFYAKIRERHVILRSSTK